MPVIVEQSPAGVRRSRRTIRQVMEALGAQSFDDDATADLLEELLALRCADEVAAVSLAAALGFPPERQKWQAYLDRISTLRELEQQ